MDQSDSTVGTNSANEEAALAQREGARRLSLEERFRQNDSMSRFRAEATRSQKQQA